MDMKRIRRSQQSPTGTVDLESDGVAWKSADDRRSGGGMLRFVVVLVGFLMILPLVVVVSGFHQNPSFDRLRRVTERGHFEVDSGLKKEIHDSSKPQKVVVDKSLGGLLASGFDEHTCVSRYQSVIFTKPLSSSPSAHLIQRLRKYEKLHQKCSPSSKLYNMTAHQLKPGATKTGLARCRYVVWISYSGLGNRMLTLASTFLYALLTNRVLLVDRGVDTSNLFCEPFPRTSWLLPLDFPLTHFKSFGISSPESYGNMLKNNLVGNGSSPSFMYLHLAHDYGDHDKLFFCEDDQRFMADIPWIFLKSDNYFVPSLFLIPDYQTELHQLFPRRDTVFHHLGRYLFHPTNKVWGLITRYYQAYLAQANERVGVQIRVFETQPGPFQHVLDQVLNCTLKQKLLPQVSKTEEGYITASDKKSKAILLTSLSSGYSEKIRNMYWEHAAATGDTISVFQPSHEEHQQAEKRMHNMKAWAEMYLLSLCDVLVTSAWSTFGYVAQGLGGLKPWVMKKAENGTVPEPACVMAVSMEPCFHAPPLYDCKKKVGADTGEMVPYVRHCEDMSWGLKLVNRESW